MPGCAGGVCAKGTNDAGGGDAATATEAAGVTAGPAGGGLCDG